MHRISKPYLRTMLVSMLNSWAVKLKAMATTVLGGVDQNSSERALRAVLLLGLRNLYIICAIDQAGDLMTARAAALEKQARKLPATERERLAERLLVQVTKEQPTAVDQAWIDEAEKRFSAWKQKKAKPLIARRALNQIRRDLLR